MRDFNETYWANATDGELAAVASSFFREKVNRSKSQDGYIRFGNKGSKAVALANGDRGKWFDHEHNCGGFIPAPGSESRSTYDPTRHRHDDYSDFKYHDSDGNEIDLPEAEPVTPKKSTNEVAAMVWGKSIPIIGTAAHTYLTKRGIMLEGVFAEFVRFNHYNGRMMLVAAARTWKGYGQKGDFVAVQRIYIKPDGTKDRGDDDVAKKSLGTLKSKDGEPAFFIWRGSPDVFICEGPEDAMSCRIAYTEAEMEPPTVVATLGVGRLDEAAGTFPGATFVADGDKIEEATEAARKARGKLVTLTHLDGVHDANEALLAYGAEALAKAMEEAVKVEAEADEPADGEKAKAAKPKQALPAFTLRQLLADTSPMPADIISPRILTPGGMLVLGGAPKIGKSSFVINLLTHLAAGVSFLGFAPPRPLRIYYLQAEIQYHYLRERLQGIKLPEELLKAAADNLVVTPKLRVLLNADGVEAAIASIRQHFPDAPPDIIVVDPIRNVFDGGEDGGTENDNHAMLYFLQERVEAIRAAIDPDCGLLLVHHTRKMARRTVQEDPFQAFSGASSLRSFYTTGMLLHEPVEGEPLRLEIELRNGAAVEPKALERDQGGGWQEVDPDEQRLVRKEYGTRLDAERDRQKHVILRLLFAAAAKEQLFTAKAFSERHEGEAGLGGTRSILDKIATLATAGLIKFRRDASEFGFPPTKSWTGYLVTEGMMFGSSEEVIDPDTGEIAIKGVAVLPSHFKCPNTGSSLQVENPNIWVRHGEVEEEDSE
jgi:hypothetical protein